MIKTFDDDVEKAKIAEKKIEMRLKEVVKESCKNNSIKKEETRLRKELKKATDRLKILQTVTKSKLKSEAKVQLRKAEKLHRKGKRVHEPYENIIPYGDYNIDWKPTNMGYGMNCN